MDYNSKIIEILQTATFSKWLRKLKDSNAKARILARLAKMEEGSLGDVESVGQGISEARIHYGPGYRLYFIRRGNALIIMLAGGDKRTQSSDIKRAKLLAEEWR